MVIHQDYLENTVKTLHEAGLVEIIDISKEEHPTLKETKKVEMHPEVVTCINYELRLTRLIDILKKRKKTPKGIKALLHPEIPEKKIVESRSLDELYSYSESLLQEIEKTILQLEEKLRKFDEQKQKIDADIKQLTYLKNFQIDTSDIGESKYVAVWAGKTSDLPSLEKELSSLKLVTSYHQQFGSGKKREWIIVIAAHISEKEKVEKICREKITLFDFRYLTGMPKETIKNLEENIAKILDEKKHIHSELSVYSSKNLQELLSLREEILLERVRKEISRNFAKTTSTYIIEAWVLEKNEDTLKSLVTRVSDDHIIFSSKTPSANPDYPPIYLETPRWASTFKTFLELFATPKYNELNPTIFMGIFFIICFGLMLGDAGYGLVLFLISVFGYVRFGKYSSFIRDWSFLGLWLGVSTVIAGILMNSFFGDFIPRFFYHNPNQLLYHVTIIGIELPFDSLNDPVTILTIALLCGLIHLNLGVILGIIQSARQREYKSMLTKNFCWIPLQIGGGMLIGHFILKWHLDTFFLYGAGFLTIIGIILLFIHAGPIGFFGITGFVGDWLSYARLLALGLATSGMALAFNVVGEVMSKIIPFIGAAVLIILLVITHTANLIIQSLGAGVHSLRLQYVEFFNRFYEGGGKIFTPFHVKRTYTKIEKK